MHRALVLAPILTVGVLLLPSSEAGAACAAPSGMVRHGTAYAELSLRSTPPAAGRISDGHEPPCNDVVVDGVPVENDPTPVHLRRIRGVPVAVAVRSAGPRLAWVAPGYLPELRSHPLHAYLSGREPVASHCTARATRFRGVVRRTGELRLHAGPASVALALKAGTLASGTTRHGLPYVARGATVSAYGRRCKVAGERAIVARSIDVR